MLFLNIAAAIALLLSYLAARYSPADYWLLAFFGLGYPVILLVNILFVLYWSVFLRAQVLISLITILIGFRTFDNFYHVKIFSNKKTQAELAEQPDSVYKIMSYNVRLFDLYNWTKNTKTRDQIFKLLAEESPDVVCFQEFYYEDGGTFNSLDTMRSFMKAKNMHVEITNTVQKTNHFGLATFTRFPMLNQGKITFDKTSNRAIYTDMLIGGDTVRVYNMHLQSIRFGKEDYKFIDDLSNDKQVDELEGAKNLLSRMKRAFIRRAWQAEVISSHIRNCPYKVMVCGDFNDPPTSYTYTILTRGLYDAFKISGSGLGRTFIDRFPSFRIDYILHSKDIKSADFETIARELSDHYPITCSFKVR
jgi:endonuclease/exonuclease/phosphatase family metal-dependent hydrolase